MIDGPTLFDTLMAGSTMLFAGATIWQTFRHRRALRLCDWEARQAEFWQEEATINHAKYIDADNARSAAIIKHERYLAAEPERQAAHLKAYFSRNGIKGNQSPKRRKAEG